MNKTLIAISLALTLAACGKKDSPDFGHVGVKAEKTEETPTQIYNNCITRTVRNLELYGLETADSLVALCKARSDKAAALLNTLKTQH